MGTLSEVPASLAQLGVVGTLLAQRYQLLLLALVVVPWVLLMVLRPALRQGSR
jgi:hypothetical protein